MRSRAPSARSRAASARSSACRSRAAPRAPPRGRGATPPASGRRAPGAAQRRRGRGGRAARTRGGRTWSRRPARRRGSRCFREHRDVRDPRRRRLPRASYRSSRSGSGTVSGPGAARNASSSVEAVAVEHAGGFRDALDLVEEAVAVDAVRGIFQRVLGEHDHEAGRDAGPLPAQDATHALDHLAAGAARAHDDAEVRVGNVDAFVEHPRRRDGVEPADAEIVEDLAPLTTRGRAGDQVDRHERVEPVDRVVRGAHRLGEDECAVGVLDRGREAAEQLVLPDRLRHDLAALGERVEVVARGPPVGARVALGEVRDRGEEVAERLERHVAHRAQVLARAHESLLDRGVLGPFVDR